jgi:sodium-coupled neutral amino acid transporter 3
MAVVLPLGFFKKISVLRYSSYLGFAFCLYLVGAVAYRSAVGVEPDSLAAGSVVEPLQINESFFSKLSVAIGIYNFTYMLHLNVIPLFPQVLANVQQQQGPRDQQKIMETAQARMSRLVYVAVGVCALLYAIFGLCAASIYGELTQGNILLNLAHDPIMAVPRVMILLTILLSFPLLFHPLRSLVLEMQWCCGAAPPSLLTQFGVSVLLMVLQLLVATRVPGIQVVFSFVGSSILLVLCYAMPTLFYARLVPWRATRRGRLRMAALSALLVVATVFCSMATIKLLY